MREIVKNELIACTDILYEYYENNGTEGGALDTAAFETVINGKQVQFHVRLVDKKRDFLPEHGIHESIILGEL